MQQLLSNYEETEKLLINEYLADNNKAEETQLDYLKHIQDFKDYLNNNKNLIDVTKEDAQAYSEHLKRPRKKRGAQDKSDTEYESGTIVKKLKVLKALYKYAVNKGCVKENPFKGITLPHQKEKIDSDRILSIEEYIQVLDAAQENSIRDYTIILLLSTSRFLPKEVANLNWGDLIKDGNNKIGAEVKTRKRKGDKPRIVPIMDDVFNVIMNDYRKSLELDVERIHPEEKNNPVFVSYKNTRLSLSYIRQMIYGLCDKLKIKRISPKDLSHMSVLLAKSFGAQNEKIVEQANFSSITVLKQYEYALRKLIDPACDVIPLAMLTATKISKQD